MNRRSTPVNWDAYGPELYEGARRLGCPLDDAAIALLTGYLSQLHRWNRTYNLTAITDPAAMVVQHVLDSLSIVTVLADELDKNTVSSPKVVDVGSGAGLPGVVLAIAKPAWSIHCVDTVEKKVSFIRQASSVLGLKNVVAHHARVELLPPQEADVVVSRAFSSMSDFVQLAGRHLASGGIMAAMKGKRPDDEMAMLGDTGWSVSRVQALEVPGLDAQRCLVLLQRTKEAG